MKTFKLSALALACLTFFYSCTKDAPATEEQAALMQSARVAAQGGNPNAGNTNQGGPNANDVMPAMAISFNPDPAIVDQDVTVTGFFTANTPPCGKLQLQMKTDTGWRSVKQVELSSSISTINYTYAPEVAGQDIDSFKLHYVGGANGGQNACTGFSNGFSQIYTLDVIQPCSFGIVGKSTATNLNNGQYKFTVTYTVQTCNLQFNKLKTQGGLTNGSAFISAEGGIGHDNWTPGQSTNQIINWTELSPTGSYLPTGIRTYVVKFTKAYSGIGPIEITGDWSAKAELNGVNVATATFPAITHVQ